MVLKKIEKNIIVSRPISVGHELIKQSWVSFFLIKHDCPSTSITFK